MHRVSPYLFRIFKQYWTQKYIMNMHGFGLCRIDQKKKVNVDKIRTVPKVSIKMKSSVKKSYFFFTKSRLMDFYVISWDVYFFCNVYRLLRIAHGSPMKAFHCLNITRLICKRCTNDGFIIMTWYLKINCMKDILVHIASAEPLTMHEHQILH